MAKQLNIDVNLNTAQAQAQLKNLQQLLTDAVASATTGKNGVLTKEIVQATEAATKLKAVLNASMNTNTGNLDLSKFSQNLAKSKMNLTDYVKQLNNLGTQGSKAFNSLAKSIITAETPMRESGKLMNTLWTTMKNTARWQISSAALHQFVGGIQSAMSYARGLNDSLNSIRIVTGQSVEQMNQFARVANQSAKQLSASTLDYTDAALIYYQQGIRDEKEIKARTDATIKMANVTGTSAQQVSEQMTAIWNNFADGSTNLEYYADVITALGAATASSSAEISKGLEKFAAVADTVGLSYEYATSALATIVATTRQSEDIVGTALKTLFARIQDLELGKTLEDGTTLGKYSKALDAVGISIKDQNGELRNMDNILDDMGAKWQTLNKDQQVALAQTVAGQRQYTQLVALMDNWDFMQQNLQVAYGAEGTLQKQAEIYAESWEAARTRVKAAAQGIYDEIISDKFFISFNNGIAGLLNGIDAFIDRLGGLPGVLGLLGTVTTRIFASQMTDGLNKAIQSIKVFTGVAKKEAEQVRADMVTAVNSITSPTDAPRSATLQANYLKSSIALAGQYQNKMEELAAKGLKISSVDKLQISALQEILSLRQEIAIAAQQELEAASDNLLIEQNNLRSQFNRKNIKNYEKKHPGASKEEILEASKNLTDEQMAGVQRFREGYEASLAVEKGAKRAFAGKSLTELQRNSVDFMLGQRLSQAQDSAIGARSAFLQLAEGYNFQRVGEKGRMGAKISAEELLDMYGGQIPDNIRIKAGNKTVSPEDRQIFENYAAKASQAAFAEQKAKETEIQSRSINSFADKIKEGLKIEEKYKGIDEADLTESQLKELRQGQAKRQTAEKNLQSLFKDMPDASEWLEHFEFDTKDLEEGVANKFRSLIEKFVAKDDENASNEDMIDDLQGKLEGMIENLGENPLKGLSDGIVQAFQGISSLAMGVSSLQAGFDALNDSSLSFGEKLLQSSMSFGMAIPMMASGISSLTASFKALVPYLTILKTAFVGGGIKGVVTLLTGALGKLIPLITGALPVILPIVAVIGAIAALKATSKAEYAASAAGQLEDAQKQADNMKSVLAETQTAADNLKSSFDSYNSIQDKLKSCAKGTQEWTEALRENNNEVLNLLAQYPELASIEGALQKNSDGILSISTEAQEEVIKKSNERVSAAAWASALASQNVLDKQNLVKQRELGKEWKNLSKMESETIKYSGFNGNYLKEITDLQSKQSIDVIEGQRKTLLDYMSDTPMGEDLRRRWNALQNSTPITSWKTASQDPEIEQMKQRINQVLAITEGAVGVTSDIILNNNKQAAIGIKNAREDLKYSPNQGEYTRIIDTLGMSMDLTAEGRYNERMMGNKDFNTEIKNAKEKGLNIIAKNWSNLMGLSAEEMGPALEKIFTDSGVSMKDSSAWAKELTTNSELRQALNQNASSVMAAATAQAATEASAINEKLLSEGYSKTDAEKLSKILGQSGQLSYLTTMNESKIKGQLKMKDTNARTLAQEYVESLGGNLNSVVFDKNGISFTNANGENQTATYEMMASALAAAHALDELGASASNVADILGNIDTSTTEGEAMLEYLQNKSFLGMKPEEIAEFGNGITSAKDMEKFFKENGITEDNVKELLGVDSISDAAQEAYNTLKFNQEGLVEALQGITDEEKAQLEGLRNYRKMTAADQIDYINKHFNKETFKLPDLDAPIESYESLSTKVDTIREKWDAVGNSIQNGTHVTSDMEALFSELGMNLGDLGEFIDGDLIVDAEGLKQALDEATGSTSELIDHAMQMDMITYDDLTNDLLDLVKNTDDATRSTDDFAQSLQNILSQMDGLELSMAKLGQLKESLTGSTSLFETFDTAKSIDAAADWTDEWTSALKDMNNLIQKGDYGGEAWKTGKQLLLPEQMQDAKWRDVQSYISSLVSQGFVTSSGKGEYDVTQQNAINFGEALRKKGLITGELGDDFHLADNVTSIKQMADALNLSEAAASALFSKLSLIAYDGNELWGELARNAGDFGTQILTEEEHIGNLSKKLEEARSAGNWNEYNKIKQQIDDAGKSIDQLKKKASEKIDFQFELKDRIAEAETEIDKAQEKVNNLETKLKENPGDVGLTESLKSAREELELTKQKWAELTGQIESMSEFEIKINLEQAYAKLQELKTKIQGFQTDQDVKKAHLVDQYGHQIMNKKGAESYANSVERTINAKVVDTNSKAIFAKIKDNYESAKSDIESNETTIKADNRLALKAIRDAARAAQNYAKGNYVAVLNATTGNIDAAIAIARAKILAFKAWATLQSAVINVSTIFSGGGGFKGSANAFGSAYDSGSWGIKTNQKNALVGELGQELIVDPSTGKYYTVGDNGAELVNIPKGAIIFNHKQTEGLLKNRRITSRGQAYLEGSAFASIDPAPGASLPGASKATPVNDKGGKRSDNPSKGNKGGKKGGAAAAAGVDLTYEQELLTIIREETNAYRNLETAVKKLNQTYEFIARNNDRLWGRDVLVNMEKSIQALNEVYKKQRQIQDMRTKDYQASLGRFASTNELQYTKKIAAASSTAESPKWNTELVTIDNFNAVKFLQNLGYLKNNPFTMDANGNYKDFDAVAFEQANAEYMRAYEQKYNAAVAAAKTEADIVAAENELTNAKAIFDLNKTFLSESDKALEDMNQAINDAQDSLEEMHDLAAQKITKRLEMRIDLSEGELKIIDSRMKSMGDSIYKMAESMTMLWNGDPQSANDKYSHIVEKAFSYSEAYDEALKGLAIAQKNYLDPHAITSEKFIEIAEQARDGMLEQVDALLELKEAYTEYYGNVLSKATEELEKYTNQMEHQASVLEHLKNLMDLTGRKYDYKGQETIIRGQLEMAKDAYEVAKHWEMSTKENMEAAQKSYEELLLTDALGAENYKNEVLDKAVEYFNEAEEKMLASAEDYLQNYENLWQNTLDAVRDKWDKLATDGMGWDALLDSMDRAKSIQDEYLTTTNKLYETNTLLRKVNKDINSTDSMISKEKLNDFAKMVEARQKDNQLTQSGMEILKAKYELLQAELALEEMKDAKDTVRLQRDSEGNYGYVYTADQEKIEDAEQKFADKQNDLYNLVLGYSNDYREKYIQSLKEYEDKVMAIYENDALTEEERQRQLNELKQQYSDLWHAYDLTLQEAGLELNQVAAEGISEAWATQYDDRIAKQSEFLDASNEAESTLQNIMKEITEAHKDMTDDAELGLNNVEKKTKDVTTANHLLAEQLHTEVIPNVNQAIDYAEILTKQWESQATVVDNLIKKYQDLAQAIQNTIQEKADYLGNHEGDLSEAIWDEYMSTNKFNSDLLEERSAKVRENNMTLDQYVWSNAELKKIMTAYKGNNMGYNSWSELGQAYVQAGRNLEAVIQAYEEKKKILSSTGITTEVGKLLSGYATGGYTGEWGPEGKLAMLHEKELVLNATDTANMLDTIEALREMTRSMNLRSMISGMVDMIASPAFLNSQNNTLQQEVHITAEFPNATNHNEIEQAFTNLVNRASQYANRSNWKNSTDTLVESSVFD